jgi:hypothetical protein
MVCHSHNKACKLLLDGGLGIESMTLLDALRILLKKLKRLASEGTISYHITTATVKAVYRKWRESTSTSPSSLHLGHEKALYQFENKCGPEEEKLSQHMFDMKAAQLNAAIKHAIVNTQRETVVNALINKIPGIPLINKLRVIHLIESDFNLMIGITFGCRLMQMGKSFNTLAHDQDECCIDRKASHTLLDKLL